MERDGIKDFLNKLQQERLAARHPEPAELAEPKRYFGKKSLILLLGLLLVVAGAAYGSYRVFGQYKFIRGENNKKIIAEVAELTELPVGETPTIATVTNSESLRNQIFFKDAQVGDKVLIYNKAKKAILYRPSTNKIISIAPLN